MKTKVSIYLIDVDRKLALIALLKDPSIHEQVIADIEASLLSGDAYKREFVIDAKILAGAV